MAANERDRRETRRRSGRPSSDYHAAQEATGPPIPAVKRADARYDGPVAGRGAAWLAR
jgi:hypothetical protein